MKSIFNLFSLELHKRKKEYTFILCLMLVGITFGSIFMTLLKSQDKLLVFNHITVYFDALKNHQLSYLLALKDNLLSNLGFIIGIWLLGLSIIGVPIILFLIFFKGFLLGFAIASIIYKFKLWGLFITIIYIFPHHVITTIVLLILSYYALHFSLTFGYSILKRKTVNFNFLTNRYVKVLAVSILSIIITSLYEVYIVSGLLKWLLVLVK